MAGPRRINFFVSHLLFAGLIFGMATMFPQPTYAAPWRQFAQQIPVTTPPNGEEEEPADAPVPAVPTTPEPVAPTVPAPTNPVTSPVPAVPVAPTSPVVPAPTQPQVQPQTETPQAQPIPSSRPESSIQPSVIAPPSSGLSTLDAAPPPLTSPVFPRLPGANTIDTANMIELSTSAQAVKPRANILYDSNKLDPAIARDYYQLALALSLVGLAMHGATYVPASVRVTLRRMANRI